MEYGQVQDQPAALARTVWADMEAFVRREDRSRKLRSRLDLTVARAHLLIRLTEEPMTFPQIIDLIRGDAPAATNTVNQLQQRGLVRRRTHPNDNRRKIVELTDAGSRAAAKALQILHDPPQSLAALDPDQLRLLQDVFCTLVPRRQPR